MTGDKVRSSSFRFHLLFLVVSVFAWAVSPGVALAAASDSQHLDGFWLLTFDLPPDQALGFLPTEMKQLANFTTDGSMLATSNLPSLPVDAEFFSQVLALKLGKPFIFPSIKLSTGHGDWVRTGYGRFQLEIWRVATCVDPAGCNIPWVGVNAKLDDSIGWATGKATVQVDGKRGVMTGTLQLQLLAPDMVTPILPPASGTLAGSRHRP